MMRRRCVFLAVALGLSGCGYSNALYHADHHFADAERAAGRGEDARAEAAFREAIDAAALGYRARPDGRRAAHALLLVGRASFEIGDDRAAAGALRHLLAGHRDAAERPAAHAWLGAALVRLDSAAAARMHLDSAIDRGAGGRATAFGALWRGPLRLAEGDSGGWADLDRAARHGSYRTAAGLATARLALAADDPARFRAGLERIAPAGLSRSEVQALDRVVEAAAEAWGAVVVAAATEPLDGIDASGAGGVAITRMRSLLLARALIHDAASADALEPLRGFLADQGGEEAQILSRNAHAVQQLAGQGSAPGGEFSLFAAAEMARDELGAARLARRLFLEFADRAAGTAWEGKAVLAARALHADSTTTLRLRELSENVYVRVAMGGAGGDAFTLAEERLARGLLGVRDAALNTAARRSLPDSLPGGSSGNPPGPPQPRQP